MEWVNITAKTLPEAIDLALDNLGVDEAEAEIEVLEEPRQGLFGRQRGNARVRARVKPKATRPKVERGRNRKRRNEGGGERSSGGGKRERTRKKSGAGSGEGRNDGGGRSRKGSGDRAAANNDENKANASDSGGGRRGRDRDEKSGDDNRGRKGGRGQGGRGSQNRGGNDPVEEASMDEVSEQLDTFLSGLTEAFGFEGAVSVDEDDGGLLASVEGRHGLMVGPKGRTLDAIQELARVTAQRSTPSNIRIKVDVGGYRALRREALINFALDAADEARSDGMERSLEPMNSADRKVVHDALSDVADIETRSAGTDPRRRVVVVPLNVAADDEPEEDGDDVATADDAGDVETGGNGAADDATAVATDDEAVASDESDESDESDGPSEADESESVGSQ